MVPTAADGLTAMSSHLRQAHRSLSIRLTPAKDLTVCRRYLQHNQRFKYFIYSYAPAHKNRCLLH